jgi:hypothetical protein
MSDEDLRSIPYAQLWLSELGATVPEWRAGEAPHRRRRRNELTAPWPPTGPDPVRNRRA